MRGLQSAAAIGFVAALLFAVPARAGHIAVAAPGGVGVVAVASDGQCSLREAMLLANGASANDDCIVLGNSQTPLAIRLPEDAVFTLSTGPYYGLSGAGPNGLPVVSASYSINGRHTTIRRDPATGTPRFRLLYVAGGSTAGDLTLSNLVLRNGHTPDAADMPGALPVNGGGAIFNDGSLLLANCKLRNNRTGGGGYSAAYEFNNGSGAGGAIYNLGELTVHASSFIGNDTGDVAFPADPAGAAPEAGDGGAIFAEYTASTSIVDSLFEGNHTGHGGSLADGSYGGDGGNGGAIASNGPIAITGTTFHANYTGSGGDGERAGAGGSGGAIFLDYDGTVTLEHNLLTGNHAGNGGAGSVSGGDGGRGGAIFVRDGSVTLDTLTLMNNRAGNGRGTAVPCGSAGVGGAVAISIGATAVAIDDSILAGNVAGHDAAACQYHGSLGGAVYGNGQLHIYNTRIEANQADYGGGGITMGGSESELLLRGVSVTGNRSDRGAALFIRDGSATLENTTVAANEASVGEAVIQGTTVTDQLTLSYTTISANHGSGVAGPSLAGAGFDVVIDHSVLAGQVSGFADCGDGVNVISHDYNVDSDASCTLGGSHDDTASGALLGPLGDHGGPVQSMLPLPAGGLVDAVPAVDCGAGVPAGFDTTIATRGGTRPVGGGCDIGAVELQSASFWRVLGGRGQHARVGHAFAQPVVVQARGAQGLPMAGVEPPLILPGTGASASCTASVTDATGVSRVQCTANGEQGSYLVRIGGTLGFADGSVMVRLTNDPDDTIFADGFDHVDGP